MHGQEPRGRSDTLTHPALLSSSMFTTKTFGLGWDLPFSKGRRARSLRQSRVPRPHQTIAR